MVSGARYIRHSLPATAALFLSIFNQLIIVYLRTNLFYPNIIQVGIQAKWRDHILRIQIIPTLISNALEVTLLAGKVGSGCGSHRMNLILIILIV